MTGRPFPELVIFDCDGVLVDSERIAQRVCAEVLHECGWAITQAELVDRFLGRSYSHFATAVRQHLGDALPADCEVRLDDRGKAAFEAELAPVDGIVEVLDRLSLPTCVASSGSHEKLRRNLGLVGLYERFQGHIFSADDVAHGKPEPDLFLHAAEQMNVRPEACVVVEDSKYGVQAARAAGMRVIGYAGGLTPAEWLQGPDTTVITDMRNFLGVLEALDR